MRVLAAMFLLFGLSLASIACASDAGLKAFDNQTISECEFATSFHSEGSAEHKFWIALARENGVLYGSKSESRLLHELITLPAELSGHRVIDNKIMAYYSWCRKQSATGLN